MPETRSAVARDAERPWLRWYDEDVPAEVEVPDRSFSELLDLAAERWPGSPALCHLGRELTYRELRHDVEQFSTALSRLGVVQGDRVALVLPNCPQFVIALFAVLRLGAVAVPLPPRCPVPALTAALTDAAAEVVVCIDRSLEQVTEAREEAGTSVREVVVTLTTDYLPALDRIALAVPSRTGRRERARASASVPPGAGVRLWSEELRRARGVPVHAPGADELSPSTDPAVIIYPQVEGGDAVGHVWTSRNLHAAGAQAAAWLTHARLGRESLLVGLPLCSVEGLALCLGAGTLLGAALQLGTRPSVDLGPVPVNGVRPTVAIGPPAYLAELLDPQAVEAGIDLRSLRLCVTGPELLEPAEIERLVTASGAAVVDGLSVVGAPVLLGRPMRGGRPQLADVADSLPSMAPRTAVPMPSTDVRVVDASGAPLPIGRPGQLEARGPQVFAGLWRRPEQTAEILRDGWLVTGLSGCVHPNGLVELVPEAG